MNLLSSCRYNNSWMNSTVVIEDIVFWHPCFLDYNKPCSFLNHTSHHTGMRAAVWVLFVYVSKCLPVLLSAWVSVRVSASLPSLPHYTPLHSASKKQRKQQSAVVDSNRPYKQHYKSSLQTSNSIQLRFGLSHIHLTQVRRDTALQPLTILAAEVTASLWPSCLKTISLSHSWLCSASFNVFPVFFCYTTKENRNRAHSLNQIMLSLDHYGATPLFKASFFSLFLYLLLLL